MTTRQERTAELSVTIMAYMGRIMAVRTVVQLCCCMVPVVAFPLGAHSLTVTGLVLDQESGETLPATTIQLKDSLQGTITNAKGEFTMHLDSLPATLRVTHIGYEAQEVRVFADGTDAFRVLLRSKPYQLEDTEIYPGDPALRIMREVIRRKQEWAAGLKNYQTEAYIFQSIENDSTIALIRQAVFDMHWDSQLGRRLVIKSRHFSANAEHFADIFSLWYLPNFYQDEVKIQGDWIVGPTHPRALDYYDFRLLSEKKVDSDMVFEIAVEPKNQLMSALSGKIVVLEREYALLEIELKPTRSVEASPRPFIEDVSYSFRQRFRRSAGGAWLPSELYYVQNLKIGTVGLSMPTMVIKGVCRMSDYRVNALSPDAVYAIDSEIVVDTPRWRVATFTPYALA